MSWLPVPRSPLTFQVSMIRACDFGWKNAIRTRALGNGASTGHGFAAGGVQPGQQVEPSPEDGARRPWIETEPTNLP